MPGPAPGNILLRSLACQVRFRVIAFFNYPVHASPQAYTLHRIPIDVRATLPFDNNYQSAPLS
jgi:hypothetical protein